MQTYHIVQVINQVILLKFIKYFSIPFALEILFSSKNCASYRAKNMVIMLLKDGTFGVGVEQGEH